MAMKKSADLSDKLKDLGQFIRRSPVTDESQKQMYKIFVKVVEGTSSINEIMNELKQIDIDPVVQQTSDLSYQEILDNAQKTLNQLLDQIWSIIDNEQASEYFELGQKIREIFNNIFNTLSAQQKQINALKSQLEKSEIPNDQLLLGSLGTQLLIKMCRLIHPEEDPSISSCRTISMLMNQAHYEQLKIFIQENNFNIDEVFLTIRMLKKNRNEVAHPDDPATTFEQLQLAINHLFARNDRKKTLANNALKLLNILSCKLEEPLFLKID